MSFEVLHAEACAVARNMISGPAMLGEYNAFFARHAQRAACVRCSATQIHLKGDFTM